MSGTPDTAEERAACARSVGFTRREASGPGALPGRPLGMARPASAPVSQLFGSLKASAAQTSVNRAITPASSASSTRTEDVSPKATKAPVASATMVAQVIMGLLSAFLFVRCVNLYNTEKFLTQAQKATLEKFARTGCSRGRRLPDVLRGWLMETRRWFP